VIGSTALQAESEAAIGRYELLRELGRGSMGVVYEARDPALGRRIALKTITPRTRGDSLATYEERFLSEARIAARLSHPGIVIVHDVGRDTASGTLYMALEFLKGQTLADLVQGGRPLAPKDALRLVAQVARALHHAHSEGVIHRDIKPANVMVLPTGEAKIMDFGIAKVDTSQLTTPGMFVGTPLFAAPEQLAGEPVDARSDIFSLGAVAFTLLTGRPPFAGKSLPEIVTHVMCDTPPPPSQSAPGVPPEADAIVARAMAKRREDRYGDAGTMAEELETLLAQIAPESYPGAGSRAGGSRPSGRAWLRPVHAAEEDDFPLASLVEDAPAAPARPTARPTASVGAPEGTAPRKGALRPLALAVASGGLLVALSVGVALFVRSTPPSTPAESGQKQAVGRPSGLAPEQPAAGSTSAVPGPSIPFLGSGKSPSEAAPGLLSMVLEHPLKSGHLTVWVDDEVVLEETLDSRVQREVLGLRWRKGSEKSVLEVAPGSHKIRVQVRWEDGVKTESIVGSFKPGITRHLEAKVGRLRKNLSLEWK
jgi:hypothetical protein